MKLLFKYIALLILLLSAPIFAAKKNEFKFYLMGASNQIQVTRAKGLLRKYIFHNTHRGLFSYHGEKGLVPEGANNCQWINSKKIKCQLNKDKMFSNGKKVKAHHYVSRFQEVIDPTSKSFASQFLLNLKNAQLILKGEKSPSYLGVRATDDHTIIFNFKTNDPEFLFKIARPQFSPSYSDAINKINNAEIWVTNGPYKFSQWNPEKSISLVENPFYSKKLKSKRPPVIALMLEDDQTALTLYDTNHLSFLNRLSTTNIPYYKKQKDFLQVPMAKFDYIGFGPSLLKYPNLRKAMSLSLNYPELQKIYHALGRPGCASLPKSYLNQVPCYSFDLMKALEILKQVPKAARVKVWKLVYSKMGGDDHNKGMQWVANQWKKHLNLKIELTPIESGMFISRIKNKTPDLFRKGVPLNRPTCLAALENFSKNNPENYIQLKSQAYDNMLRRLSLSSIQHKRDLCSQLVGYLLNAYKLIPMGRIHYSMRINAHFKGWHINELNQLDLTNLTYKK